MNEIVDGVFHWSGLHERIGIRVHSTFIAATDPPVLIDPMPADVDLSWFAGREPRHIYLTNRHHYRGSAAYVEAFGCDVRCHEAGLHEFAGTGQQVLPYRHGDELPGGIRVLEVGSLCPEETALLVPLGPGVLALGDSVVRSNGNLAFVPDAYIGDDPDAVKAGLRNALHKLLTHDFDTLVLAHGDPWITGAQDALRTWLDGP